MDYLKLILQGCTLDECLKYFTDPESINDVVVGLYFLEWKIVESYIIA